ncbi:hypothetical protein ACFVR1_13485 [Psychrobacillus sp. NPDC058041]|uniref:hypothetical protein n=1 Tax=Psychrobacillus sp. NPDC058041 TaxID=3346310 RepID=UPI0036DBDDBA
MIKDEMDEVIGQLQVVQINFQEVVQDFLRRFEFKDMKKLNEYVPVITMIANTTRVWENRGHTPEELS